MLIVNEVECHALSLYIEGSLLDLPHRIFTNIKIIE